MVGIRELRQNLCEYLRRVMQGETLHSNRSRPAGGGFARRYPTSLRSGGCSAMVSS